VACSGVTFTFTLTYVLRSSFIFALKLYLARQCTRVSQFCVLSTFSDSQSRQLQLCVFYITRAPDCHGSQQNWSLLGCDSQPDQKQSAPADLTNNVASQKTPVDPNKSEYKYTSSPLATRWYADHAVDTSTVPHAVRCCHTCSFAMSTSNNSACHNSRYYQLQVWRK
jgi:hypothetical protein